MSTFPSKRSKIDEVFNTRNLLDIPDEVLEFIFLKLPVYDVQWKLALVCKRFLKISRFPCIVKNFSLTLPDMDNEERMNQCLSKAKRVLALYPNSKLELRYFSNFELNYWREADNQLRMWKLKPFSPFLKKIIFKIDVRDSYKYFMDYIVRKRNILKLPIFRHELVKIFMETSFEVKSNTYLWARL